MKYKEALEWLNSFQVFGIKPGLERISYLAKKMGHPHQKYRTIHVAGSNGKGSVCRYLGKILEKQGYKVGIYTSPHQKDISERITVNSKPITKKEITDILMKIRVAVREMSEKPTYFEILTILSFFYFKKKKVDIAIIETGLGGRFDATNIIKPILSIITNVSLEHQKILGENIEDIAFEKAGIIKENIPLVTAAKNKALNIIKKQASKKNADIRVVNKSSWRRIKKNLHSQTFRVNTDLAKYEIDINIQGEFQGENLALVINSIEILRDIDICISKESIYKGFKDTQNIGRMDVLKRDPLVILDGAHNPAAIQAIKKSLLKDFNFKKIIIILGVMSDKDLEEIISLIIFFSDLIVLTKPNNKRSASPLQLKKIIDEKGYNKKVFIKEKPNDALRFAESLADRKDLICITGSLFLVGEIMFYFEKKKR
ncbi:MAG: folylpolyglutamate synthase/dihydrofolate synthase family protein [Candidatus Thermoplasmatota archaeon]